MSVLTDLIYAGSNAVAGLTEGAVNDAIAKASKAANKNVFRVALQDNRTIPHEATGKVGRAVVLVKPAKANFFRGKLLTKNHIKMRDHHEK